MTNSVSFKTRARTIDHLGREQIADCPTAISELWKNSYDAYARSVELHIFDGEIPVATLVDDGHGMDRAEFENKWLTIGTDSKITGSEVPEEDRDGLPDRPKQGQKGIGRLSCAALGPLLLIVSKRDKMPFVAALIDWRLFENPFLLLQDIRIPIIDFEICSELKDKLPDLFGTMMGNIWGERDDTARNERLAEAWSQYSKTEQLGDKNAVTTKTKIESTLIKDVFSDKHLATWAVWNKKSTKGTAMFMAEIHQDLEHQTSKTRYSDAPDDEQRARLTLQQTLVSFIDVFQLDNAPHIQHFNTSVTAWIGDTPKPLIEEFENSTDVLTRHHFDKLEHIVEGAIDKDGYFTGRVKVFGEWHDNVTVKPKAVYKTRKDTRFGPFKLLIGGYEATRNNSIMGDEDWAYIDKISRQYGGLMIYRDHLRVMPYGREGNDYFEIEKRRTKNAGRYFWSARKTFGCINITRKENPNLKDKAGREGLIDNKASKLLAMFALNVEKPSHRPYLFDIPSKRGGLYGD